jgi:hypothetical protein
MIKVAQAHGAKLSRYGHSGEFVGACPVCGTGRDRFAINPKKGAFNCRVCGIGGRGAVDLEMFLGGCDFVEAVKRLTNTTSLNAEPTKTAANPKAEDQRKRGRATEEASQHAKAAWLWQQRQSAAGSALERYLRARGYVDAIPPTIGYLPAGGKHPHAMLSAFALPSEVGPGELGAPLTVRSVHLTKLNLDGSDRIREKGGKIIVGRPLGLPIVIAPPNDLLGLAVCEGIKDALTAHAATGVGTWAAGSAGFMPKLAAAVPSYIEAVTIYAHNDKAGEDGARQLAAALHKRRIEVVVEGI